MQYKSVKSLLVPLIKSGQEWQSIDVNGQIKKPKLYLSNIQWFLLFVGAIALLKLPKGFSQDIVGYIMSAFGISVSLFMSLLVSIFDKFENTSFKIEGKGDHEIVRLKQKKNFFKRFISITSYLVILSIVIVVMCSFSYILNLPQRKLSPDNFTLSFREIDIFLTIKSSLILLYRTLFNYLLLNYLLLTIFITSSAFEYYMSEINSRIIEDIE